MKRSIQGNCKRRPAPEDTDLALVLHCVTCGTLRAFVININFAALEARQLSSIGVESTCSVCGHCVGASIAWTNQKRKDFTFHSPPPMESIRVEDGVALQKPRQREGFN